MGRSSSKGSTASGRSNASSSSVVAKLEMLRNFCPSFSEKDLSTCLSQAGYNVQLAAERLMTGQFEPTGKAEAVGKATVVSLSLVHPASAAKATKKRVAPEDATNSNSNNNSNNHKKTTRSARLETKRSPHVIPPTPRPLQSTNINKDDAGLLLLCERWLVGTCTTRYGRVFHRQVLEITHSDKQRVVRFRGSQVEGTLCRSLAQMLSPLLGYTNTSEMEDDDHDRTKLLELRAEALMDDRDIPMGGEVPLKLTVYLRHPRAFFALFDGEAREKSSKAMFFHTKNSHSKQRGKMTLAETAFAFLQWAQHGNLPEMPDFSNKATAAATTTTIKGKEDNQEMMLSDDDDDNESGQDVELNEADFEAESGQGENVKQAAWVKSVNNNSESDKSASLPEMEDPKGFTDSVALRPYQRQALYWMMKREQEGESREELEKELALLSELAASQGQKTAPNMSSAVALSGLGQSDQPSICCDCGPVLLSDEARKRAKTLDGEANPVNHPLWKPRFLTNHTKDTAFLFYVNELLGVATCTPPAPPKQCSGGILADDMGLGKTVMLLALILKCKEMVARDNGEGNNAHGPTLVVVPLSLISQWEEEICTKTKLSLRICYGDQAKDKLGDFNVDIVLTTWGTMQAEFQKQKKNKSNRSYGLLDQNWLRVILDEAHAIKNQSTLVSKAACAVKSKYRWVVTGTIIHNSLDDVYGLIKFLQHQPWCEPAFWNAAISSEMKRTEKSNTGDLDEAEEPTGMMVALERVRRLLGPMMLRRTKDSLTSDGKPILTLPPVESKVVSVKLSEAERDFYNALLEKSQDIFDGFMKAGTASKSWFAIFSLLHRLRMACDHIALTVKSHIDEDDWNIAVAASNEHAAPVPKIGSPTKVSNGNGTVDDAFLRSLLEKFKDSQSKRNGENSYPEKVARALDKTIRDNATHISEECAICLETPLIEDACVTNCAHMFCKACLVGVLKENAPEKGGGGVKQLVCFDGLCPVCQGEVKAKSVIVFSKQREGGFTTSFITDKKPPKCDSRQSKESTEKSKSNDAARQVLLNAVNGAQSSKLTAVVQELHKMWELDPGSKVLVFSQFLGFLDMMETSLSEIGIPFGRLDGKMTLKQRVAALDVFKADPQSKGGSVMLVSMGLGCGLNLVAASSVFIVDPWWNQAIEDQCISRIHRIGQKAEMVRVRKFVVEDSVEERIVELQRKKKGMANEVYSDIKADGTMASARLSVEDFKLIFSNLGS